MIRNLLILFLITCFLGIKAQSDCNFNQDTVFIPKENKVITADYLQTTLKNKEVVTLYKTSANKYYLKLIVTKNLYFNKIDMLEIRSGSKSFYAKDTKHYQYDKQAGYYIVEIFRNYVATLKDDGITAIAFGKVETDFSKKDCSDIKQISKCFYESIVTKK